MLSLIFIHTINFSKITPPQVLPPSTLLTTLLMLCYYWYSVYTFAIKNMGRIEIHNREIMASAEYRASQMNIWPSPLEERMKDFLDENYIEYESQKIFYIYADDGWIIRYYIADFFIPHADIIIEVDGKFHDDHKQHDKMRTREIQEQYPEIEVLRYKWKDLSDRNKMEDLLNRIG